MDGTYVSTFDLRLPRADLIVWLKIPRYQLFYNVYKRSILNYGYTRPDMAEGCIERLPDLEFLSFMSFPTTGVNVRFGIFSQPPALKLDLK